MVHYSDNVAFLFLTGTLHRSKNGPSHIYPCPTWVVPNSWHMLDGVIPSKRKGHSHIICHFLELEISVTIQLHSTNKGDYASIWFHSWTISMKEILIVLDLLINQNNTMIKIILPVMNIRCRRYAINGIVIIPCTISTELATSVSSLKMEW